jgi:hypothetical protein
MKTKYEQLIEFIINEEEDKARALFHEIVVEKSRDIYESLIDEEDLEEAMGGDDVEEMVDEITDEENEMHEAEEDPETMDMDMDSEEEGEDSEDSEEMGMDSENSDEEPATKSDIMNIKDELEAIADRFDQLMGMDDKTQEMPAADADMMGDEGSENMPEESLYMESKGERRLTEAEWLREYMEKVGSDWESTPAGNEGHEAGAGKSAKVNAKSTVAGKNDMGGKSFKLGNHTEAGGDSTPSADPKGLLTKGGEMKTKGEFTNKVGGMKKADGQMKPQHGENKPAASDSVLGK